ncbi:MAG: Calcium-translocating P-type ATPase, PMCA-type [Candidatus Roizmanbacteria bacterium GW2011_GWA2_37_7]|uniref:Calcium-translocating P-type ATPase, PMCA-type n=1 Tax=Candidatus Roizmanbacteria bacterium GW2011_GWA2_37_7 TaxID=1618481 RepID=A0A0G0JL61_9BACT|nr:MAG: Calcium-translocating P-type ATPase, PMCA-type [Candidatus Roizmanbacteria bacterium GW2011_GWA2_37_7]
MEQSQLYDKGLSSQKAKTLLIHFGNNEISEVKQFTVIKSFIGQFDNILILLLIAAGCVSFFVGERLDSMFIFLIVILNSFFGLYQEFKAEKALSYLKKLTVTTIRVIRDGKEQQIDSRDLVPGDLIYIEEGAKIPADCQVVETRNLEINEAALTGESLPVVKNCHDQKSNQLFMGTVVAKGRGYAQVLKTGNYTKFGTIAKTLSTIKETKTPLQKKLDGFTKQIGIIGIAASSVVFILSFIQEKSLIESFIFAVSLAVAAVPEGLPAVMTITLAIGVERMAKKKAIVRKLNAIEALGSITVIATDKTGTLTANQMRVKKIFVDNNVYEITNPPLLHNQPFSKIVLNGILCSTAALVTKVDHGKDFDIIGDATEGALLLMAHQVGMVPEIVREKWKITDELPFDPVTKRMAMAVTNGKEKFVFSKGAPESILSISSHILTGNKPIPLTPHHISLIESEFERFARQGLRMIAFSYKENNSSNIEKDQIFLGFVGIADPVRGEVTEAVRKTQEAGIKVIMITGDNPLTAEAIGIEAGIIKEGEDIITGKQLDDYSDEELIPILGNIKIFARTSPEHKYRLVKLLQKQGEVVAVTGDGVNDALALKQANIGVAMGITGTDVAKETAHMVITDDNFATLVGAVEEGRNIFNHIKNAIKYLLACNIGEVIYVIAAVIFQLPMVTALQLLYINLVTDGLPAMALAFSPNDSNIMREKPRRVMTILGKHDFKYVFLAGIISAVLAILSFLPSFFYSQKTIAVTLVFSSIIFIQQFILVDIWLSRRSLFTHFFLLKKPIFILGFLFPFILHPFIIYNPFFQKVFSVSSLPFLCVISSIIISLFIFIPLELLKKNKF